MRSSLYIFLFLLILVACKKNETKPPEITITSPLSTDSFYVADSIKLDVTIEDANLQSYKIILSNAFTRVIYFKEEGLTDSTFFSINKNIFIDVAADTSVLLNVLGLDKNGNTGNANVTFKLKK